MNTKLNGILIRMFKVCVFAILIIFFIPFFLEKTLPLFHSDHKFVQFISNFGVNDWIYDLLPNAYEVVNLGGDSIIVRKNNDDGTSKTVIDKIVTSFCYNDKYMGVEEINDNSTTTYYLICFDSDTILGPYSLPEYEHKLKDFQISFIGEWIETDEKPEQAHY